MKKIQDYKNAFDAILEFEENLANFTGAPYVVTTDCCSHAIEIAFRLTYKEGIVKFPARTYLSVPMTLSKLDVPYEMTDEHWQGHYQFLNTKIWDSARAFGSNMYKPGQIQCISFGRTKPMALGRGGCLLTDNRELYESASRMRSDGRDLFNFNPWSDQINFEEGYHYWMRPEDCVDGLNMLDQKQFTEQREEFYNYPDCRTLQINKYKKIEV
jgi:dTDP-4-amino-4,6-dideoxygalactose transaminase